MKYLLLILAFFFLLPNFGRAFAVADPTQTENNRFGIHIISPVSSELDEAQKLVNSNGGEWGYVTLIIESKDRKDKKWQDLFNELRRRKLIPIVRIATFPEGNSWSRPSDGDPQMWADFLNELNWPVKNRYVVIYNEPNHATEWGGMVDPVSYARQLNQTIDALKAKDDDFFVINGGFDTSTPHEPPAYYDQVRFMEEMNRTVPGIFNKLDGWNSHSYPQPEFSGSPSDTGRGSIRTWEWEMQILKNLGVTKQLPVFITETGWKHSEGVTRNRAYPSPETVAKYYQDAFNNAWNNSQIIAITPFILNYQSAPFDHFSFKKPNPTAGVLDVLAAEFPDYFPQYQSLIDFPKVAAKPIQESKAIIVKSEIPNAVVVNEVYTFPITVKNTGQTIWNDTEPFTLIPVKGGEELGVLPIAIGADKKVEPGQEYTFEMTLSPKKLGQQSLNLQLLSGQNLLEVAGLEYSIEIKSPVLLKVKSALSWKDDFSGDYLLTLKQGLKQITQQVKLNARGESELFDTHQALPDVEYEFTIERPFYGSKSIKHKVISGENVLDFGQLEPNIFSALINPQALWELLPFSN